MSVYPRIVRSSLARAVLLAACGAVAPVAARHGELPNRIPEPAPYNTDEARFHPPPFERRWLTDNDPALCAGCHRRIFDEWNGSMMANSWRDPAWRAAFLLLARMTATDGSCDIPDPPDGTVKARINPFANDDCSSTFDLGGEHHTTHGGGSLLDAFCSRCHMPTNYADHVALETVSVDLLSGREHGLVDSKLDPTSDAGTGIAFAREDDKLRNTASAELGISCAVCHTMGETRATPYRNFVGHDKGYRPALGLGARAQLQTPADQLEAPDPSLPTLGYSIGAGAYRLSPHAIATPERFGPLTHDPHGDAENRYVSGTFKLEVELQQGQFTLHRGYYHNLFERSELCGTCHDVTNVLTIANRIGRWVGGFPIERTYTEWAHSRYAERPGNDRFDPDFKRDCQTCHMQQDYGRPATARTDYGEDGRPLEPLRGPVLAGGAERLYYTHHFVGGNAYTTAMIGAASDGRQATPYPELSAYSFSSADPSSVYYNAYWIGRDKGAPTQHARLAWDRLSAALTLSLAGPSEIEPGAHAPLRIAVVNSGAGHNFPTGFPEGRNAWIALHAWDLSSGQALEIFDAVWQRRSLGVGDLTAEDRLDPNFPDCGWKIPAGSPDPYAYQFRAVASLGDGCPTLALPLATALNLVVDVDGVPVDSRGKRIDRRNPDGLPQYRDLDGDGDRFDDSFLIDTRLRPLPHAGARLDLDRYSVVVPRDSDGPIAVTAAIYYQSMEAVAAKKLLGNLADLDEDGRIEPGVLGGAGDGRVPTGEPAVVEGSPPVPMAFASHTMVIAGREDRDAPAAIGFYPRADAQSAAVDSVAKVFFSEPVTEIDGDRFVLTDEHGAAVPAFVRQVGESAWGLFPHRVFLRPGGRYNARLAGTICDLSANCAEMEHAWSFRVAAEGMQASGDSRAPAGFSFASAGNPEPAGPDGAATASVPAAGAADRPSGSGSGREAAQAATAPPLAISYNRHGAVLKPGNGEILFLGIGCDVVWRVGNRGLAGDWQIAGEEVSVKAGTKTLSFPVRDFKLARCTAPRRAEEGSGSAR